MAKLDFIIPRFIAFMSALITACAPMKKQPKPPAVSDKNSSAPHAGLEGAILSEVNRIRSGAGLAPLRRDPNLDRLARMHSRYMKSNQGQLDLGSADISRAGKEGRQLAAYRLYGYEYCDENVASFTVSGGPEQTAESIAELWEEHPDPKNPMTMAVFNRTGISVIQGSDGYCFVTQIFGKKSSYPDDLIMRVAGY